MKKIGCYILLLFSAFFLGFGNAEARQEVKNCIYSYTNELSGTNPSVTVVVTFYDDGLATHSIKEWEKNTANLCLKMNIWGTSCKKEMTWDEYLDDNTKYLSQSEVSNWKDIKDKWDENNVCPTYIYVENKRPGVFETYLGYDFKELKSKHGDTDVTPILTSTTAVQDAPEDDTISVKVTNAYSKITEVAEFCEGVNSFEYKLEDCADESKYITRYEACEKNTSQIGVINTFIKEINDYVSEGIILKDDEKYVSVINTCNSALEKLRAFKKEVEYATKHVMDNVKTDEKHDAYVPVCGIFKPADKGGKLLPIIKNLYKIFKIAIPLLVVILTIVEFLKVLFSGEDKTMKDAFKATTTRLILIVVLVFLPILIEFVIKIAGLSENCLQKFL